MRLLSLIVAVATFAGPAFGAEPATVTLTPAQADCLRENRTAYLEPARALIFFTPALCPETGGAEVRGLAFNSEDPPETRTRQVLSRKQFSCLIARIDPAEAEEAAETGAAAETGENGEKDDAGAAETDHASAARADAAETDEAETDQAAPDLITVTLDCP